MKFKSIAMLALAAVIVTPAFGDDKAEKKKKKGAKDRASALTAIMLKKFDAVGLTDDQTMKIKTMGEKVQKDLKAARESAGITQELQKKLAATQKSMKDSKLKGKERLAAVYKEAGISEAQIATLKKSNEARQKFQMEIMGMLSDEQKEKLPAAMKRGGKKGGDKKGGDKKGKKKKKDAA